jgi:hypothetical protein
MQAHGLGKLKATESSDRIAAVVVISIRSVVVSGDNITRAKEELKLWVL